MDASVGTEIGTMTEPDCLGPLDPGTSVTLEGIVWNETDGMYLDDDQTGMTSITPFFICSCRGSRDQCDVARQNVRGHASRFDQTCQPVGASKVH